MTNIEFIDIQELNRSELLNILNKDKVREHLAPHDKFKNTSLDEWIKDKAIINAKPGCKVNGILVNAAVAGWCGIQYENDAYELAIVLDPNYWGIGINVFKQLMKWAHELGHRDVVLHLAHSRPEYKFLLKLASDVYESSMFGHKYISYKLNVPDSSFNLL